MPQKKKDNRALLALLFIGGALMYANKSPGYKGGKLKSNFYDEEDLRRSAVAKAKGITQQFKQPLSDEIYSNANYFIKTLLEPLSEKLGKVTADSWWRSSELNKAVGGVHDSRHMKALAGDLIYKKNGVLDNELLIKAILLMDLPFYKMIISGGLKDPTIVHMSLKHGGNDKIIYLKGSDGSYSPVTRSQVLSKLGK